MVIKRLIILLLCIWCGVVRGATFCAESDKVVLGANMKNGPKSGTDIGVGFDGAVYVPDFGVVRVIASCSLLKPNQDVDVNNCRKKWGQSYNSDLNTHWGHVAASNGDVNDNYYGRSDGNECWCKMMHPFESGWVYVHNYGQDCKTTCAANCAVYMTKGTSWYGGTVFPCMLATVGLND